MQLKLFNGFDSVKVSGDSWKESWPIEVIMNFITLVFQVKAQFLESEEIFVKKMDWKFW